MMELLRTRRLALRSWTGDDLAAYFDLYSRWEVRRWLGPHPRRVVADRTEARERLHRVLVRHASVTPPLGLWALVPHEDDVPMGTVLLMPLADAAGPTGEVEVGWHLHPDRQGRGLVTEAARALLDIAALPRVLALTDPDNGPSQAVAGRLGMTDEGLTDRWFGLTTRQFAR
ncbi:GNAT family N-acetyltransferase [Actinoplanes sp. NPDC049599]|uniref:GNAT family N-acetyltransferase n=1 Tax=Actinoplanes sp. NPDC049599 TaxID=3363903 RepID=UPI00379D0D6E